MPTCAIYARVSDESQVKGDSIEHQISFCQEIARRRSLERNEPWITPDSLVYVDEGITGTSLIKRAEVLRLIRDARTRTFEVVLFKGISRFARDTVDALLMLRTLLSCGVRVISIEENFDSQRDNAEFVFTIHSALAQAESEKTAVRVRMGATQKARQGKWNGQPPDGYVLNRETQRLEIDETFAPVIRQIFSLYLTGHGARKIAETLNASGTWTKHGNFWSQRHITRLLRNPAYVGDVAYGRRAKKFAMADEDDPLARRKQTVWVKDEAQVTVCRDAHPAIVDRPTFGRVAALMATRQMVQGRTGKCHLLTKGLMKCRCGSSLSIKYNPRGTAYYCCLGHFHKGKTFCAQRYIRADEIEAAVLARVKADVMNVLRLDSVQITYDGVDGVDVRLSEVQRKIETLMRKSQLLFDQFADGVLSDDQFMRMNGELRARMSALRKSERELTAARGHETAVKDTEVLVRDTIRQLMSKRSPDTRVTRQLLEVLVEHVLLTESGIEIKYRFANSLHANV